MTAFETAWALLKADPHSWTPGRSQVGKTGLPSSYECIICGAERHGAQERDPNRVGQDAIDRFGEFYDTQGHVKEHGIDVGWSVPQEDGPSHHYTNPTKPECEPDTLHDSPLMRHRKSVEEYLNPPPVDFDTLPQITNMQYFKSPSLRNPDAYVAFEATTEHGRIKNDGMGGATYFEPTTPKGRKFENVSEWHWDEHITNYEQTEDFSNTFGEEDL